MRSSPHAPAASSAATVAAEHGINPRHVSRIATPNAVAAWREQQVTLAISPRTLTTYLILRMKNRLQAGS